MSAGDRPRAGRRAGDYFASDAVVEPAAGSFSPGLSHSSSPPATSARKQTVHSTTGPAAPLSSKPRNLISIGSRDSTSSTATTEKAEIAEIAMPIVPLEGA